MLIFLFFVRFSFIHPPQCIRMHVCLTSWLHLFEHLFICTLDIWALSFFWTISGKDKKMKSKYYFGKWIPKASTLTNKLCLHEQIILATCWGLAFWQSLTEKLLLVNPPVRYLCQEFQTGFDWKMENKKIIFWRLKVQSGIVFVVNLIFSQWNRFQRCWWHTSDNVFLLHVVSISNGCFLTCWHEI